MNITPEQRSERFNNASLKVKQLYSSSESGVFLRTIFIKYRLDESLYKTYAITIGNVILGFHSIPDLEKNMIANLSIDEARAKGITADLIDFLSPVLKEQENKVAGSPVTFTPTTVSQNEVAETTPIPEQESQVDEEVPKQIIEPIRTMEHDMDRIHGYGSYRKLYPDNEVPIITETSVQSAATQTDTPIEYSEMAAELEQTVQSLSQEDVLKRSTRTETPAHKNSSPQPLSQ